MKRKKSCNTKVFICQSCRNQSCKIEVNVSDDNMERFLPKYCPYSSGYAKWDEGEDDDGFTRLVPKNTKHKIRNTGKMWVVETVRYYGNGFSSKEEVKYFYSRRMAEEEYEKRKKEDKRMGSL